MVLLFFLFFYGGIFEVFRRGLLKSFVEVEGYRVMGCFSYISIIIVMFLFRY